MGMYNGTIPDEEIKWPQEFAYPQAVTEKLLDGYQLEPGDWGLLDIGCGSNPALAMYTNRRNGYYFGLDVNEQMLGALQEALWKKSSNYTLLPYDVADRGLEIFGDNTFEVVHMRFALMRIPDIDKRVRIMKEAVRVARRRVLFLEWDWSTFKFCSGDTCKPLKMPPQESAMYNFFYHSCRLAERAHVDLYAGKALAYLELAGFKCTVDQRPFGDYTDELAGTVNGETRQSNGLCHMSAAVARKLDSPAFADIDEDVVCFERLIRDLPELRAMCRPPAICIAELRK